MSELVLTFDTDWAPDFMIDEIMDDLIANDIKSTWFITHESPAIKRLIEHDLFEVGIHPNIDSNSTQGNSEKEIISNLLKIHKTDLIRTHGLLSSTNLTIRCVQDYKMKIDSSLLMPHAPELAPFKMKWDKAEIWKVPIFWEDDYEALQSEKVYSLNHQIFDTKGLKVFNFHPIHIHLNTVDYEIYKKLKKLKTAQDLLPTDTSKFTNPLQGPRTLFREIVRQITANSRWISELI